MLTPRALSARLTHAFRDAARQLQREPVSAILIVSTMTIGIAAAAAIFTVARGVLLRPLPYRDESSLIAIQEFQPAVRKDASTVAFANLARYKAARSVSGVTAFAYAELVLSGGADAERIIGANVDEELFPTLGVQPLIGRGIEAGDVGDNPARVAVLGYGLWARRFGGDRGLVGKSITIDGQPYTVVGVTGASFEFPRSASMDRDVEIWLPRRPPPPMMARRGMRDLAVIARLRPGTTQVQAQQELAAISRQAEIDNASLNKGWSARAIGVRDVVVARVQPTILMLVACVATLLLIACANASAAILARVTMRRHAFGIRLALGASNARLIELVLAETILLATAAALIALPLSAMARGLLIRLAPVALPRQQFVALDAMTIAFTAAVAIVVTIVAAALPISWLRRVDVRTFIGGASRTAAGSRARSRSLATFITMQLALGTALLAVTLTVYGYFVRINRVNPGFDASRVTTATIPLRGMRYRDGAARSALTTQLLNKVRAIPGVEHAAVGSLMPLSGGLMSSSYVVPLASSDSTSTAALRAVSSDFFQTLGIPVKLGRAVEAGDNATAVPIAVVNEAFVHQALGAQPAVGASVLVTPPGSDGPQSFQIVGVVGNAKEKGLLDPDSPVIYFSDAQASFPHTVLAFRSRGTAQTNAVRAALRELDPSLALDDVGSLAARVRATYGLQFFLLNILGAFAASALLLIGVGVYGSVSYVVASDLRSIGVRMALGATSARILSSLLARTAAWSAIGCAIGFALSLVLIRLFGSDTRDSDITGSLIGAAGALALALLATLLPARRASRTDPLSVLNSQ